MANRQSSLAPRTVVVGSLCLVAAAALVMSRQSSIVNWVAEVDATGNLQRLERVDTFEPSGTTTPAKIAVSPGSSSAVASTEPRMVTASLRSTEDEPESAASPSVANEQAQVAVPATIAGCLEHDADSFWLRDVSGADAPKSRSWKSGFLRKKSPSVELVDRGGLTNRLTAYVGRRIETSGTLVDREMRVKSVRVLGSCE